MKPTPVLQLSEAANYKRSSRNHRLSRAVTVALLLTAMFSTVSPAPSATASSLGDNIVAIARGQLHVAEAGARDCNVYSFATGSGGTAGCPNGYRTEPWCSAFAKWVWQGAGVADTQMLNSAASTFYQYGIKHGTYHAFGSGYIPQPGDAVMFGSPGNTEHVGLVESAGPTYPTVINGNFPSSVERQSNQSSNGNGALIYGYTSPVGSWQPSIGAEGRPLYISNIAADNAYMKQGIGGTWIPEFSPAVRSAVASDNTNGVYYAVLDSLGQLWIKQGISGTWSMISDGVADFSLTSDPQNGLAIGTIATNGNAYVKQGLGGTWTPISNNVRQIALASDAAHGLYITQVSTAGSLLVKQGVSGTWTPLSTGVQQVSVTTDPSHGPYFATVSTTGDVSIKAGVGGVWTPIGSGHRQVAIASDSISGLTVLALSTGGVLFGKQGIGGTWTPLTDNMSQVDITSDPKTGVTIAAVRPAGGVYAKSGLFGQWVPLSDTSSQVALPR